MANNYFDFIGQNAGEEKKETPQQTQAMANVTVRCDADCFLLCDGEYLDIQLGAGKMVKLQVPIGQHLLEFLYTEDPDIKIEKEVDFPESGKSYLVIIKGLKELVDGADAEAQAKAAEEEAKRKAKEKEAKRKAEAEAKRKAEEEAKLKAEEEAKRKAEAEAKRKAEEEAKRKAKEKEAKRKAEAEAKRKAEEEAKRKAAEEEARRKIEEAKRNGHEWVDLGLSVKWATCNIGATSPEGYGDYFAWGETSPKSDNSWESYKHGNAYGKYGTKLTKYCTKSSSGKNGFTDGITTLLKSDDAAQINWGGSWRMPTRAEQEELRERCIWNWTTLNGVKGCKVTSKVNGNSIFLPAITPYKIGVYGEYWSSSLGSICPDYAYYLLVNSNGACSQNNIRCGIRLVRAVCP